MVFYVTGCRHLSKQRTVGNPAKSAWNYSRSPTPPTFDENTDWQFWFYLLNNFITRNKNMKQELTSNHKAKQSFNGSAGLLESFVIFGIGHIHTAVQPNDALCGVGDVSLNSIVVSSSNDGHLDVSKIQMLRFAPKNSHHLLGMDEQGDVLHYPNHRQPHCLQKHNPRLCWCHGTRW